MKVYSKSELKDKAKDTFKNFPKAKKVFITTDGQCFLEENRANIHAKPNKLEVVPFSKTDFIEVEDAKTVTASKGKTVEDIKAEIKEVEDVKVLEEMLEAEQNGKNRTTAIEAIQERIKELNPDE